MKIKLLWTFEFIINFNYLNLFIKIFTGKIYKVPTKYKYIQQYYKSIIKSIIYYKKYYKNIFIIRQIQRRQKGSLSQKIPKN